MASSKAIKTWENRKHLVANYYADWENWLPIMQAYENGKPSYFGTPPVNLIVALETSLKLILEEGIDARIERHQNYAQAFREALHAVGLELIASSPDHAAHTLSAVLYPSSIDSSDFTKKIGEKDVIVAGGLLPSFKTKYFRVGHMGSVSNNDLMATLSAIEYALGEAGYIYERGESLVTFQRFLND
jgi:alanine-glyoxylate transaminase/serine-glyoxylate transaminase/serine-pyruvate transaminase